MVHQGLTAYQDQNQLPKLRHGGCCDVEGLCASEPGAYMCDGRWGGGSGRSDGGSIEGMRGGTDNIVDRPTDHTHS